MAVEEREGEGGVRTASETPMLMATAVAIPECKVVLLSRDANSQSQMVVTVTLTYSDGAVGLGKTELFSRHG